MIDLYQLRTFLAAAREESFSRAASVLYVSPPAVSQSIALLERSVGKPLFRREGRRVWLNAEGAALKAHAQRVFDEVAAAEAALGAGPVRPPELRLAVREMVTHYLLPLALAEQERRRPGTRFSLHELEPGKMSDAVLKDRVDCGYYYAPVAREGLAQHRLGRLSSHVYAAPALLKRLGRPSTPAQTVRLPFVAPRPFEEDPSAPSADGFPDDRLRRDIRYRAEFLETHRRLALAGLCAAVLPDGVALEDVRRGRLARLPGPRLGRELYAFTRDGRPLPPAVGELNAALRRELARWG